MAIGISLFLNIKLPINFDSPYKSSDIIEFWRRWHMTLSAFLRDYLYIPLGGNLHGKLMRYRNIMLTMLLGGLWHGAGWTFVLWGGLHGTYLLINNEWKKITGGGLSNFLSDHVAKLVGCAITFTAVVVAWVPFRSESFSTSMKFYSGMFGLNGISFPASWAPLLQGWELSKRINFSGLLPLLLSDSYELFLWLFAGLIIVFGLPNTQQIAGGLGFDTSSESSLLLERSISWRKVSMAFLTGGLLYISFISLGRPSPFLYFQF